MRKCQYADGFWLLNAFHISNDNLSLEAVSIERITRFTVDKRYHKQLNIVNSMNVDVRSLSFILLHQHINMNTQFQLFENVIQCSSVAVIFLSTFHFMCVCVPPLFLLRISNHLYFFDNFFFFFLFLLLHMFMHLFFASVRWFVIVLFSAQYPCFIEI